MIKIAVDCRMIENSGIGNFLKNILTYLSYVDNLSFLLVGDINVINKYKFKNSEILDCKTPIFSVKELLLFPYKDVNKCDLFFSPNYNIPLGVKVPIISTIHDVVFLDHPEITTKLGLIIRYAFLKYAFLKSKGIVTVSNFSKARIEHYFGKKKEIKVLGNGITHSLIKYKENNVSEKIEEYQSYIVYVGNIKKHKGLKVLVEAYLELKKNDFIPKLVIVGEMNNFRSNDFPLATKIINNKNIIFTGKVSDQKLFNIIQNANVLLQPSIYEGFGMPPLEAMYLGTLPILSDIPVFIEIYNDTPAIFFECGNKNDLKEKLIRYGLNKEKIEFTSEMTEKFCYKKISIELLSYINKILK